MLSHSSSDSHLDVHETSSSSLFGGLKSEPGVTPLFVENFQVIPKWYQQIIFFSPGQQAVEVNSHLVGGGEQASAVCVFGVSVSEQVGMAIWAHSNTKQGRLQFLCCFSPQVTVLCTLESDQSAKSFHSMGTVPHSWFPHLMGFD